MEAVVSQMQSVLGSAGDKVLGALVFWTLAGVRILRSELREEMGLLGLGGAVGRDPRPEALLAMACQRAQTGRKTVLFRRMDRYRWAIMFGERVEGDELKMEHHVTVCFRDGQVWLDKVGEPRDLSPDVVNAALAAQRFFIEASLYADTSELSETIVGALHGASRDPRLGGISLRERSGGLYFVPATTVDRTQALAAFVTRRAFGQLVVLKLHGDAENLAAASMAAKQSFATQLRELREELVAFKAVSQEKGLSPTDRSIEVRVDRLSTLQDRVAMFSDVLGGLRDDLNASIEAAKAEVVRELGL